MTNKRFKAVLFDKDGVLLDSVESCRQAVNETFKHYRRSGWDRDEFLKNWWGIRADLTINRLFKNLPESKKKEIFEHYKKKRDEFERLTKLYPSTIPVLDALKGKYKLGVITSTFGDLTRKLLKNFGILDYFDVVVAGEETRPKPAPDPILKACKMLSVEPSETVFVGDTVSDVKAGTAAGCTTVVLTTTRPRKEFESFEGVIIIKDLKEILEKVS